MCRHWIKGGLLASGAFLLLGLEALDGQSVEAIMRAGERLELTEEQVQQLDAIRREAVAQRTTDMARIAELRSQLQAGQIRRSELMAAMEDQREVWRARAEERRASIDAILTEVQRDLVDRMPRGVERRRPGFGPRTGPGVGRGGRRGFAPRARPGFAPRNRVGFAPGGPRAIPTGGDAALGSR